LGGPQSCGFSGFPDKVSGFPKNDQKMVKNRQKTPIFPAAIDLEKSK